VPLRAQKPTRGATLFPLFAVALGLNGCTDAETNPILLSVPDGQVQGQVSATDKEVIAFKGIPYAKPPIGPLRWVSPQPVEPWSGRLDARHDPPACMQQITDKSSATYRDLQQSEDCLYLNVHVPTNALADRVGGNLPVLFLIHGGGRTRSAVTRLRPDIAALNRQGIVVVTPQYRLGIFGFFAHPELSAQSPQGVSGNYGTQDLLAALEWVQVNIDKFGGDPSSVTIMGPSGGGTATGLLLATPRSKGLFHRAAPLCSNAGIARLHRLKQPHLDQPSAEDLGVRFAESLNAPSLETLQALPAKAIQQHVLKSGVNNYDPPNGAGDVVDGWILPESVITLHQTGARIDVPVMLGFNADEVSLFNSAGLIDDIPASPAAYEREIRMQYGELADRFIQQYPSARPADATYAAARDRVVSYGAISVARHSHNVASPTYLYYMAHRAIDADQPVKDTGRALGVSHCTGYKYFTGWYPKAGGDDTADPLAETMFSYLINFIKTGNPNGDGLAMWQPYTPSGETYMRFEAGAARPSTRLLPGMWELHESIRLRDENQGKFRSWLGGWASRSLLQKNGTASKKAKAD